MASSGFVGLPVILTACLSLATGQSTAGQSLGNDPRAASQSGPIRELSTPRFRILHDGPPQAAEDLGVRLERVYADILSFARDLDLPVEESPSPLSVWLLEDVTEFRRLAGPLTPQSDLIAGVYDPRRNLALFCNPDRLPVVQALSQAIEQASVPGSGPSTRLAEAEDRLRRLVEWIRQTVIHHEAAHLVLFNAGLFHREVDHPPWLVEGLACMFEPASGGRDRPLARLNRLRLADLREDFGCNFTGPLDRPPVAYDGRMLPLAGLIGGADLMNERDDWTRFRYAQAWSLVEFLNRTYPGVLARLLRIEADRRPSPSVTATDRLEEFTAAVGCPIEELERRWLRFVQDLAVDDKPDAQFP